MNAQPQPDKKDDLVGAIQLARLPSVIKDSEVKADWYESFSDARCNVAIATPLLAYMMFQCEYHWTLDPAVKTAGALPYNGKNYIFINPLFWMHRLENNEQRAFVLLHEILHIFQEHSGRQTENGYNHELWNIATDYNINLVSSGTYKDEDTGQVCYDKKYQAYIERPQFVLYDERFIGMSSDEIYRQILEENDGDAEKAIENHGGGKRPDGEDEGEGQGQGGQPGQGQGGQPGSGGKKGKPGQMPLDDVSANTPTDKQLGENRQTTAAGIAQAQSSNGIGANEAGLVRAFGELTKPRVNWKDELNENIAASTKERPTYNRLSRRTGENGVVFPSLTGQKIRLVWGVDTSGSMSDDELREAAVELKGVLDQFEAWEVHLVTCDVRAHLIGVYSSEDGDDFSSVSLQWVGGGGTDMEPIATYAADLIEDGEEINAFVLFTDGYIPEASLEEALPMECHNLMVITSGGTEHIEIDNCKTIYMRNVG